MCNVAGRGKNDWLISVGRKGAQSGLQGVGASSNPRTARPRPRASRRAILRRASSVQNNAAELTPGARRLTATVLHWQERRPERRSRQHGEFMGKSKTSARITENLHQGFDLGPEAEAQAVSAALILRLRNLLMKEIDAALAEVDISHARQQVLAVICRLPDGAQMGEIATHAAIHPATLTGTIDRLVRDGLIKRRAVTKDRRASRVVATEKGRQLYAEARDALIDVQFGLADVPTETLNRANIALDKVAEVLEGRRSDGA